MDTKGANKVDDDAKVRKNSDNWKFPKIPAHEIYKKQPFAFFPKSTIKDYDRPIEVLNSEYRSLSLLPQRAVEHFRKRKHKFLHLGLVQVAINPLVRDGLDAPITVCLRDGRKRIDFKNSWLALVQTNLSRGPFYFNCFPSFSATMSDVVHIDKIMLNLRIKSTGMPLALTVKVVCKAMVDLNAGYLEEPMLGKTAYYHATSSTSSTTLWDEVELVDDDELAEKKALDRFTQIIFI